MTAFTEHPHSQGVTYFEHMVFAMGIARRLSASVAIFAVHALLPFIGIGKELDLEATMEFLLERNKFIEQAAATRQIEQGAGALTNRHCDA